MMPRPFWSRFIIALRNITFSFLLLAGALISMVPLPADELKGATLAALRSPLEHNSSRALSADEIKTLKEGNLLVVTMGADKGASLRLGGVLDGALFLNAGYGERGRPWFGRAEMTYRLDTDAGPFSVHVINEKRVDDFEQLYDPGNYLEFPHFLGVGLSFGGIRLECTHPVFPSGSSEDIRFGIGVSLEQIADVVFKTRKKYLPSQRRLPLLGGNDYLADYELEDQQKQLSKWLQNPIELQWSAQTLASPYFQKILQALEQGEDSLHRLIDPQGVKLSQEKGRFSLTQSYKLLDLMELLLRRQEKTPHLSGQQKKTLTRFLVKAQSYYQDKSDHFMKMALYYTLLQNLAFEGDSELNQLIMQAKMMPMSSAQLPFYKAQASQLTLPSMRPRR